jgi:hypothetical protein
LVSRSTISIGASSRTTIQDKAVLLLKAGDAPTPLCSVTIVRPLSIVRIVELALPTSVIIRRKASDRGIRKFDWDGYLLRLIVRE